MNDLTTYIAQFGIPNAVIDFNGNDGLIAGIWGFDEIIEYKQNQVFLNGHTVVGNPIDILQDTVRGTGVYIRSNSTGGDVSDSNYHFV